MVWPAEILKWRVKEMKMKRRATGLQETMTVTEECMDGFDVVRMQDLQAQGTRKIAARDVQDATFECEPSSLVTK